MQKVLGVGGVFLRFKDREATAKWYRDNLGFDLQEAWWGTQFPLHQPDDPPGAHLVWGAFAHDTDYFGDRGNQVMVNYRVADLDAMLAQLRANGCDVDERVEDLEFGRFGWVTDPEGNRIELWQPPQEGWEKEG